MGNNWSSVSIVDAMCGGSRQKHTFMKTAKDVVTLGMSGDEKPADDRAALLNAAKQRAMLLGCAKRDLSKDGDYTALRFGRANKRMHVTKATLNVTTDELLNEFGYPPGVVLFLRIKKCMAVIFLIMFAVSFVGTYDNYVRSGIRNKCRAASASIFGGIPEECGWNG
eukprot:6365866-Prymnesium_polylepis.1